MTTKAGSQASRSATRKSVVGAVCKPGNRPMTRAPKVTARKAVWCRRNNVMADRLAVATAAHAIGRRIHRARRSRSSMARPTWAMPKVTTARAGGLRFEIRAPFTPTMPA